MGGFSDVTQYPSGLFENDLTATRTISLTSLKVSHIVVANGDAAAASTVTFRDPGAGTTRLRVRLAANTSIAIPAGFTAPNGLEVLQAGAAGGSVFVHCAFYGA